MERLSLGDCEIERLSLADWLKLAEPLALSEIDLEPLALSEIEGETLALSTAPKRSTTS